MLHAEFYKIEMLFLYYHGVMRISIDKSGELIVETKCSKRSRRLELENF